MATEHSFSSFYQENKILLKEYIDLRIRLFRLQAVKMLSRTLSLLIVIFIVCAFAFFIIMFLGMAFAWWLADKTGSNVIGFSGAAAVFILFLLLIVAFRKPLFLTPLVKLFIQETTKDLNETE
jgi:hypothetical protein